MEYFVLKGHDTTGPFSEEDLRRDFAGMRLHGTDLVRPGDSQHWTPLRKLLDKLDREVVAAPGLRSSSGVGAGGWTPVQRAPGLWDLINARPLRAGIFGVVIAMLLAFFSRWPLLVALPGLMLGVISGLLLVLRNRPLAGGIICLAAILLPIALVPSAKAPGSDPREMAASAPAGSAPMEIPQPPPLVAHEAPKPPPGVPVEAPGPAALEPLEAPAAATPAPPVAVTIPGLPPALEKPAPEPKAAETPEPAQKEPGFIAALLDKLKPAPKPPQPPEVAPLPALPAVVPPPSASLPARPEDLVFVVDTGTGRGSGFLAADQGRVYFFTNLHVVSGAKKITARSTIASFDFKDGNVEVASDRDLVRFAVPQQPALQFSAMPQVNDAVVALGNSGGREVVTRLEGKVLGVGPSQVEVSSEFIPGNSGGPLIDRSNRVLGIATYVLRGESVPDWIKAGTRFSTTRRFGVRVTDDVKWEPMPLATLLRQTALEQRGEETFSQYIAIIQAISKRPFSQPLAASFASRADLRIFVDDYNRTCRDVSRTRNNINQADYYARLRASLGKLGRCMRSSRDALRRDLGSASKGYMKERETELIEAFDKLATAVEQDEKDLFHM